MRTTSDIVRSMHAAAAETAAFADARTVRSLSFHARYACRHSGACCTADWPIPIEADRFNGLKTAVDTGRLRAVDIDGPLWSLPPDAPPSTPATLASRSHACVFFDRTGGRICRIHSALGHDALPLACRQFPRVSIVDPRGVSVTLSHYCPTAAGLLDTDEPISIVGNAPGFPPTGEYVGLDARSSLPPLLTPDLLMDWGAWWEWERLTVDLIGRFDGPMRDVLGALGSAVERLRTWTPQTGALVDRVRQVLDAPAPQDRAADDNQRFREVVDAIPPDLRPTVFDWTARTPDETARRFLAAHAFANWTAHLGQGLRTWLRSLDTAAALLNLGLGVRQADLLLRHLADPVALARSWRAVERPPR
jgi:Fe-S-cluster containining protein